VSGDAALRRLQDRVAIEELKARYFRFVDTRRFAEIAALFTAGATLDIAGTHADGRDAIVDLIRTSLEGVRTVHHGAMPEIAFEDDDHATGIWAMQDVVERPGERVRVGFGHYHERYVRDRGGWRIASLRLDRLRLDHVPTP
jgi:SnoaL-like domain